MRDHVIGFLVVNPMKFRYSYHPKYFKSSYAFSIQVIKVRCKQKRQIYSKYKHKERIENQTDGL